MNPTDLHRLQLLAGNAQALKKEFAWHNVSASRLAALLWAVEDRTAAPESIRGMFDRIKQSASAFSSFRGLLSVALSAVLSLREDPEGRLNETMDIYEQMRDLKFKSSDYLVFAAFEIAENAEPARRAEAIERTRMFYEGMKANHRFLTSQDDYIFSALLGLSELPTESTLKRMEQFYAELKPEFRAGNGLQALTHVLVLGEADAGTIPRMMELRDRLKERKLRMDKDFTLPSLGLLALLPTDTRVIVDDIEQGFSYLREQKGFGRWSITEQELLLLVSGVVISRSVGQIRESVASPAVSNMLMSLVAAQQAVMIATIVAMTAASAAASSS
ncbi:DUF4003 family protein [Saccharibacillus sp. O23]|uniref:DUF4003 family protein n=1 Tax=Saccharibacillus sp. O23 TaxID=2009338 RepID=UPI0015C5C010|nr:DUF4003 family protein [Saccharibacillus sp. O23]